MQKKNFFARLFCKHEFKTYRIDGLFFNLRGDNYQKLCCKCGKPHGKPYFLPNFDE